VKNVTQEQPRTIGETEAYELFKGWFNNKMTVLIFLIRHPNPKFSRIKGENQIFFLQDLEHHFLRPGKSREAGRQAIRWLKAFCRAYPNGVTERRREKALQMIRRIYDSFGFPLNLKGERS
jgi:hypothetical protein